MLEGNQENNVHPKNKGSLNWPARPINYFYFTKRKLKNGISYQTSLRSFSLEQVSRMEAAPAPLGSVILLSLARYGHCDVMVFG